MDSDGLARVLTLWVMFWLVVWFIGILMEKPVKCKHFLPLFTGSRLYKLSTHRVCPYLCLVSPCPFHFLSRMSHFVCLYIHRWAHKSEGWCHGKSEMWLLAGQFRFHLRSISSGQSLQFPKTFYWEFVCFSKPIYLIRRCQIAIGRCFHIGNGGVRILA